MELEYADMHCDTISRIYEKQKENRRETLYKNTGHVDLCKMKKGKAMLQNFALYINMGKTGNPLEEALRMADLYYEELKKNENLIAPVYRFSDIGKNSRDGKISALLTVEEGGVCKGELSHLRNLYRLGVRMMTLTWNYTNEIGSPALNAASALNVAPQDKEIPKGISKGIQKGIQKEIQKGIQKGIQKEIQKEPTKGIPKGIPKEIPKEIPPQPVNQGKTTAGGLTLRGKEIVREMERIGMIIDVSHLSDAGFYDVLEITQKPFVASHSNARAVCGSRRNLTDDMIRKLSERGGVMGLNFYPDFLTDVSENMPNPGTIAAITEHVKHVINVGGIDCLGLGSDFDGIEGHGELPDCSYMPRLADALRKYGLSEDAVEKIFYRNVLRVYEDVLAP